MIKENNSNKIQDIKFNINWKKIGLFFASVVCIFILVLVSIPNKGTIKSQATTFIYNNDELSLVRNNNELTNEEKEAINSADNQTDLSIRIEDNQTFSTITDDGSIEDTINGAVKLVDGYTVKIDDHTYYLDNRDIFDNTMKELVRKAFPNQESYDAYINSNKVNPVDVGGRVFSGFKIENNIEIKQTKVPENQVISSEEDFKFQINNENQDKKTQTIEDGQTIEEVLNQNDLNKDEFAINNQTKTTDLFYDGMEVVVNKPSPVVDVVSYYQYSENQALPYQQATEYSDTLRAGEKKIKQAGKDGVQKVTYQVKVVNGKEVSTSPIDYEVIEESSPEITLVGTKEVAGVGSGNLRWPASGCRITNGYGGADLAGVGHLAIDIQSWYGAPIYAADNGVVSASGWDGYGGGNAVTINHGNGMSTTYAHMMSAPLVSVGQRVERGQIIGYEGASGLATGPHLHFEVKINGQRVNPLNYVSC